MTVALIVLLALVLTAVVVVPLARADQIDPLPDERDPELQDLEEERDALLGAIRELDGRTDLTDDRRDELRSRYEAKAAKVLRSLDDRRERLAGRAPAPARPAGARRAPWGLIGLLVAGAGIAASLGGFVLPRVGQDAMPITFFEEDLATAERVRDLRQAAQAAPSGVAWAAVGDAYWQAQDADGAEEAYRTAVEEHDDAPASAYQRLGLLELQDDLARARVLLEQARLRDGTDPNTLGTLGEIYFVTGDYARAEDAFEDLLAQSEAAGDEAAQARLQQARTLAPLAAAAEDDPSSDTLRALGEALWEADLRGAATRAFFAVLTEHESNDPTALARVGTSMFLEGRGDDAIALLDRARQIADATDAPLPENALLFLGNAAFTAEAYDLAIDAWEDHLQVADDPGRVPGLIAQARALRDGDDVDAGADLPLPGVPDAEPQTQLPTAGTDTDAAADPSPPQAEPQDTVQVGAEGEALYRQYCAACHGPDGGGGAGPRLAGNPNSAREANVASLIRFGRGSMPGFAAVLEDDQVDVLRDYVVERFGP
ncbi:MAG: c-type cytochrome [Trueperaceae bacterium]